MAISLKPENLRRYKDIAVLLVKHARTDFGQTAHPEDTLDPADSSDMTDPATAAKAESAKADAEQLASDLEEMGPTFVKLGQLLSTRADFLPPAYIDALSRLQDQLEPFPFTEVEAIITAELGVRLSSAFREFDPKPLAVASLGQVHRATLRSGRLVAVKVQRPGIRETIAQDIEALREIAGLVDRHTEVGRRFGFEEMLDEFAKSLVAELDYRVEASNLDLLAANLADHPRILVPAPVPDYTTASVLTMEFVSGKKVTALGPLAKLELDGTGLAEALFAAYLDQILRDGFFHADPHPGNVFITDDGRLALIDLGMVARVAPETQARLVKLLLALSDGRGEETADGLVELGERIGEAGAAFDEAAFRRRVADLVGRHQGTTLANLDTGRVVLELVRACGECGLRPPPELTLLGKALLNLDLVARTLDPDFDPNQALRAHAGGLLKAHLLHSSSPGHLLSTALEAKELVERLPGRLNRILDAVAKGELEVKVDAIDEVELMRGFQKVANRVTLGLVIAALIMGAAMVMRVPSSVQLLGYPALAIVLFVIAAGAGLALVVTIMINDRRPHR